MERHFPLELYEQTILNLKNDLNSLKRCSLTCRTFRPLAQKLLFETILITSHLQCKRLLTILSKSSGLIRYIKRLKILYNSSSPDEKALLDIRASLSRLCQILRPQSQANLAHLLVCPSKPGPSEWDIFFNDIGSLKEPLKCLTRLLTLQHLDLHRCREAPLSDLLYESNIKSLKLSQTTVDLNNQPLQTLDRRRLTPIYLETLILLDMGYREMQLLSQMMDGTLSTWLKLDRLRRFRLTYNTLDNVDTLNKVFDLAHESMVHLHLRAGDERANLEREGDHFVNISPLTHLERLVLSCYVTRVNSPIPWLLHLLQQCSTLCNVRTLVLNLRMHDPHTPVEVFARAFELEKLDAYLSSAALGHVRRVQVTLCDHFREPNFESKRFRGLCGVFDSALKMTTKTGKFTGIQVLEGPFDNGYDWPGRFDDDHGPC